MCIFIRENVFDLQEENERAGETHRNSKRKVHLHVMDKKTRICMLGWKKDACFATVMISKYKEMVALVPVAVWR